MDETILTVDETKPTESKESSRRRIGTLDSRILKLLSDSDALIAAARREPYAASLAQREISAATISELSTRVGECREKIARLEAKLAQQKGSTVTERSARTALLDRFAEIQSAAAQKWADDPVNKGRLATYGVGKGIRRMTRSDLDQAARTALTALATDTLPGISAEKKSAFGDAITTWKRHEGQQSSAISDRSVTRQDLNAATDDVARLRRVILRAADAEWPSHNPANRPIRAEFGLPRTKPLIV